MRDFHVHTHFSSDAKPSMEETVLQAIHMGLQEICFTDHVEFDPAPPWDEEYLDVAVYAREINRLRGVYGDKLAIGMGAEIGYQPHVVSRMNEFAQSADFDFIICSLHSVDKLDFHTKKFMKGKTVAEGFQAYFEAYLKCVKDRPDYDVLGHFDMLKRYASHDGKQVFRDNYDLIKTTFKELIHQGKGIEINTSGYRYKLDHTLPTLDFLKLYKELGGEILTLGSDAHFKDHLADKFDVAAALAKEAGFSHYTRFEGRKAYPVRLDF
ncbi:MAG: histidinol-phosphatase HisJ family protein [Turicibacter sp.]|nr:histidinol-phosphatase HisJ family protein [Turicibacter sp.]